MYAYTYALFAGNEVIKHHLEGKGPGEGRRFCIMIYGLYFI